MSKEVYKMVVQHQVDYGVITPIKVGYNMMVEYHIK